MCDLFNEKIVFFTLVRTPEEELRSRLLIESLRSFGGELSQSTFWVFFTDPQIASEHKSADLNVQTFPLKMPNKMKPYYFSDKVLACAYAEELAVKKVESLVWIDSGCMFFNPPHLFNLGTQYDAAVRPVHVRNVGLPPTDPLDTFWKAICNNFGIQDIHSVVTTFLEGQVIRSYFNSHAFSINPSRGLMRKWFERLETLVNDKEFQEISCMDEWHKIFLHQAVISVLLVTNICSDRLRILPPDYIYPYNLHQSVPSKRRASSLNELVCIAYENRPLHPDDINDIEIHKPIREWLSARARID